MKVLVTGGSGFLGSHLIDRIRQQPGTEVFALVRNPEKTRWLSAAPGVTFLEGHLHNIPDLPDGLAVVYHIAGLTKTYKQRAYFTVNQEGTANLIRALDRPGSIPRIVHFSSLAAAGPSTHGRPVKENDTPHPVSPYGMSKRKAEEEVLKYKDRFPLVLLRVGPVYGPRDEDFLEFFRMIHKGYLPRLGRRKKSFSLCYVIDAVEAALLASAAEVPSGEIFNIAHPEPSSWEEMGETAARLLGQNVRGIRIPLWIAFLTAAGAEAIARVLRRPKAVNLSKYKEARLDAWIADITKARDILGFEARTPLVEGMKATLDWYIRNGFL